MHMSREVEETQSAKPEIIKYYNKTKGGVDTMDKMLAEYTVKRRTLRLPLAFFYNMIDVTGLACYVIYREHNARFRAKDQRRKFLKEFANRLCMASMEARSNNRMLIRNHFIPRRSGNGAWTTNCDVTRKCCCCLCSTWQSWTHSDHWQLLCLPRPEEETTKNQEKLCDLRAACLQRIFSI